MLDYLAIFLFLMVGLFLGAFLILCGLVLGKILGHAKQSKEKDSPYECGFPPMGDAREPFDVRYYLVAILFLIFDLEIVFFLPWAVSLKMIGLPSFLAMMLFLLILIVGFIYELGKGALKWQ